MGFGKDFSLVAFGAAVGGAVYWVYYNKCQVGSKPPRKPVKMFYESSERRQALLISNSSMTGLSYLDHVEGHIKAFLGTLPDTAYVLFVPYAQKDHDGYAEKVRTRFGAMGYTVKSIHQVAPADRNKAVEGAACVFIGGGNSFRLLKTLYEDGVMPIIQQRVNRGDLRYIGSSAGANVACPSIRTTNDMPIVKPAQLDAMSLVPFQINTHYLDKAREVQHHMGETREKRLDEFFEENTMPLVALREGSSIRIDGSKATLLGPAKKSEAVPWKGGVLRLMTAEGQHETRELGDDEDISFLLKGRFEKGALMAKFDVSRLAPQSPASTATNG